MLSDQQNGTFRRGQRRGMGANMLGPMLQQGMFARTAPITSRFNSNRAVNSMNMGVPNPGAGYGGELRGRDPFASMQNEQGQMGLMGRGFQPEQAPEGHGAAGGGGMNPLLAQLGMLLMAQQSKGGR